MYSKCLRENFHCYWQKALTVSTAFSTGRGSDGVAYPGPNPCRFLLIFRGFLMNYWEVTDMEFCTV